MPTVAELDALAAEYFHRIQMAVNQPGRFIGSSLLAWIKHAHAAGIAYVPAKQVLSLRRKDILESCEPGSDVKLISAWTPLRRKQAELRRAGNKGAGRQMLRWDPCAGEDLKFTMAQGLAVDQAEMLDLHPGDIRAFGIIYEYPAEEVPVLQRPWIEALQIDNYPVEFRVFIEGSKIRGVSNYYPQRALPAMSEHYPEGDVRFSSTPCYRMAEQLIKHLEAVQEFPWMMSYQQHFDSGKVNASLDFIVRKDGKVLFLEAGPPLGAGAHPCCFIDSKVEGLKLELDSGVELR
jgi:hypothetical protein